MTEWRYACSDCHQVECICPDEYDVALPGVMTPGQKAEKREAVVQGLIAKGHTRERAEELIGTITTALFGPGGRFVERNSRDDCESA